MLSKSPSTLASKYPPSPPPLPPPPPPPPRQRGRGRGWERGLSRCCDCSGLARPVDRVRAKNPPTRAESRRQAGSSSEPADRLKEKPNKATAQSVVGDGVAGGNLRRFWNHSRETDLSEGTSEDSGSTLAQRSKYRLRKERRVDHRQTTTRDQSGPNAGSRQLAGLTNRVEPCSQRDAVATEQQGLQGNSMSKELPNRGALGAIWALSSAVPETTQRASREKLSRNSRMQILRRQQVQRNPVQNTVEEALGMPRMTRNRKIPGGTVAMN